VSVYRDPDIDRLADEQAWDPDLRELAHYLRATPHPYGDVEPSPQFRQALQRRLMREAWQQASRPPRPWYWRLLAPQPLAAAAAVVGAVLIVFTAFFFAAGPRQTDRIDVAVVSPQQNARLVSTVQPIELQFSQPMDQSSVRVDIQPATSYQKLWSGSTLRITPDHGLSANTQYQVSVVAARTASQKEVAAIKPVVFSTGPAPTPTPSVGPTPTVPPTPVLNLRQVAPIGTLPGLWLGDGSGVVVVGPTGTLQQIPLNGSGQPGQPVKLAEGVTLSGVAPDGSVAWVSGGQVTWKSTAINGVSPIGLGFRQGSLLLATAADVETADQRRVAAFKESATAVDFSPAGDRLAYVGASGLHLVDLTTGRDAPVAAAASGLGDWSPDDRHYAFPSDGGASVADIVSGTSARLVDLPGMTGLTWSRGNQLLLSTPSALFLATYTDGSRVTAHQQQRGVFGQPQWAPDGSGRFTFKRPDASGQTQLWVATLNGAIAGLITQATPGLSQDELVSGFMNARKNQLSDQALSFLDNAGKDSFTHVTLVYTDPTTSLARYYVLLSQSGRVVVRLVLVRGTVQMAVDETLGIQADAGGRLLIHSVSEVPRAPFASGPEVISVTVSGGQVQVVFDSDLAAGSVTQPGAVGIKGVPTQATFDPSRRTVTVTVPGGLTSGTTYDLVVGPALQDVNQRHALSYDLQFTGP
jgi:hypothetical protein